MERAQLFVEKMRRESLPQVAIDTFIYHYSQLESGHTGLIPEETIEPVKPGELDDLQQIAQPHLAAGRDALASTVIIKLNGGLGTTMGLEGAKSRIPVKNGLTFLDITALQVRALDREYETKVPLVLMNSFRTFASAREALRDYSDISVDGISPFLMQNKYPKISADSLLPARYPENPDLEWNPPGHGDLFTALVTSGLLDQLLKRGYRYAFVSNIDNLGASLDLGILGYFAERGFPFLMEVTDRTHMDRKGGHLARNHNGHLILRESAQCSERDTGFFRDIGRHRFFNTNNLWLSLPALQKQQSAGNLVLKLPMIRNTKRVNPLDPDSPQVYQIESAMGAAISAFKSAGALRVPRSRFVPVKTTDELLLLWSDYFELTDDYRIVRSPTARQDAPAVLLDSRYYGHLSQLQERFPSGPPSFIQCESFRVTGDVGFGTGIKVIGRASVTNAAEDRRAQIGDSTVLSGDTVVR